MYDFRDSSDETTTQVPCPKPRVLLTVPEVTRLPIEYGGERCKSIAVPSSHVGLTPNPITPAVIAGWLAQDPGDITAFGWGTCLPRPVRARLGRPAAAPEVGLAS